MARAGRFSDFYAAFVLSDLAARCTHLSVMTSDPFALSDPRTAEPAGRTYARCAVTWATSGRLLHNTNALLWTGITQGTALVEVSGWDAPFNGNMLFAGPCSVLTFDLNGSVSIAANAFFVGMDS